MRKRLVRSPNSIEDIVDAWQREMPSASLDSFLFGIYAQRIRHMYTQSVEDMCRRRFGLRQDDMRVLLALRRTPQTRYARRPADLAQSMLITPGAVTKKVARLQRKRFVSRIPDGGAYLVQLTDRGHAAAGEFVLMASTETIFAKAMATMSFKERAAGGRFCRKLITALEKEFSPPAAKASSARTRAKRSRAR